MSTHPQVRLKPDDFLRKLRENTYPDVIVAVRALGCLRNHNPQFTPAVCRRLYEQIDTHYEGDTPYKQFTSSALGLYSSPVTEKPPAAKENSKPRVPPGVEDKLFIAASNIIQCITDPELLRRLSGVAISAAQLRAHA